MSKLGKKPIIIPKDAKVKFANYPTNENNKIALLEKKEVKEIK